MTNKRLFLGTITTMFVAFVVVSALDIIEPTTATSLANRIGTYVAVQVNNTPTASVISRATSYIPALMAIIVAWYMLQIIMYRTRRKSITEQALRAYDRGERIRMR